MLTGPLGEGKLDLEQPEVTTLQQTPHHAHSLGHPMVKKDQTLGRSFFFSKSSATNQQLHCGFVAMGYADMDAEKCQTSLCHETKPRTPRTDMSGITLWRNL
ncbi:hypothetical protein ILYODFUR_000855 [Ilyodon furcidens]|uniref:Uncharacterized protein n=1 Tax=Ilyodon furcidens TaxID=33524 RepID=A0ABV0T4E8_9TELE